MESSPQLLIVREGFRTIASILHCWMQNDHCPQKVGFCLVSPFYRLPFKSWGFSRGTQFWKQA
jgi:hypothetical protein